MKSVIAVVLLICALPALSRAQEVLLDENFEGDLSAWETIGFGVTVPDPLDPSNQVLSFTGTANSGNMWSFPLPVNSSTTYVISFRYLGNAGGADTAAICGWWIRCTATSIPVLFGVPSLRIRRTS